MGSPSKVNFNFVMDTPKSAANAVIAFCSGSVYTEKNGHYDALDRYTENNKTIHALMYMYKI